MDANPPPAVLTSALTRRFGERLAVDSLDLRIERSERAGRIEEALDFMGLAR